MDSIRLIINNLLEKKITQDQAEKEILKLLAEVSKRTADYELSFEMIKDLTKDKTISKVIDTIFKIFTMLFSMKKMTYISINKNEVDNVICLDSTKMDQDSISELINFAGDYHSPEGKNGFTLKIKHQNHIFGYIDVDDISFPEYKDNYLNMAIVLSEIFGLAISNALLFQALNIAISNLKKSNKDLEEFASFVSHDLKQPLTTLIGNFNIIELALGGEIDLNPLELLNSAKVSAFKLSNMIDGLLKYARVGYTSKNRTKIDVNSLIEDVKEKLKRRIQDSNATIRKGDLPLIFANEIEISQLFQNLLDNGIKYRSNVDPIIDIEARKKDDDWLFSVRDNGIGIKSNEIDKLFKMFQRVGDTEAREGTGIGLSICKKIITNLGGNIWIDSEYGKGSTFYFTIPILEEISEGKVESPGKSTVDLFSK